jgi:two-component system LytT family response regulator
MDDDRTLQVLIVDDELLARQRLEDLLATRDDVRIVDAVDDGEKAIEAIRTHDIDLVFLDVQMPGYSGVDVVETIGPENMPVVIFVTAYDQYALKAFDVAALDYLLKPFDDERFEQALDRAREAITLRKVDTLRDRLATLLDDVGDDTDRKADDGPSRSGGGGSRYLERIAVEARGQVRVVPVESIDYVTASGPYAELHVGDTTHVIRERMQTLEDRLDPSDFMRVHRSTIVRLDQIDALLHNPGGDYAVRLKSGERLSVSRSRREDLENRLGLNELD